jgi:hypothetical protein
MDMEYILDIMNSTLQGKEIDKIVDNSSEDEGQVLVILTTDGSLVQLSIYDNEFAIEELS